MTVLQLPAFIGEYRAGTGPYRAAGDNTTLRKRHDGHGTAARSQSTGRREAEVVGSTTPAPQRACMLINP